jgi:hypothetical protein
VRHQELVATLVTRLVPVLVLLLPVLALARPGGGDLFEGGHAERFG